MNPLDFIRYWLAFLVLASHLPSLFLWLAIHPFAAFWRKIGAVWSYVFLGIPVIAYMAFVWIFRIYFVGADLGANAITMVLAGLSVTGAFLLKRQIVKLLNFRKLSGFPELSKTTYPGELLSDGIYGIIRNPRYIEALLWVLGYSFFANYSGPYLVWLISLPIIYFVVVLEERELRERFGEAYNEYCRRVPRFIPRFGARTGPH
jgi:protein-S-isoprenylcysteine O-methyltransferase Ste14